MPEQPIRITTVPRRLRLYAGGIVIADTRRALRLEEKGYPPRYYIPADDVDHSRLQRSNTVTHCPFKGSTEYLDVLLDGDAARDAAWCYPAPLPDVAAIAGHLAFDHPALEERMD
jgi:uncharacterized protein (DUF427 family)